MTNPQADTKEQLIAKRMIKPDTPSVDTQCKCPRCENIYVVYPWHFDEDGKCPKCEDKYGLPPLWTNKVS